MLCQVLANLRCPSEVLPSPSLTPAAVSTHKQVQDTVGLRLVLFCPMIIGILVKMVKSNG
jgi:hypothetical protein